MTSLLRKSARDLLAVRWQAAGLALLVAVVVTLMAGAGRARGMMEASADAVRERLAVAHLDVRCSPTLPDVLAGLPEIPGIAAAEERMLMEGVLRKDGMPDTPARIQILRAGHRPAIDRIEVLDGRWPEDGERAVLLDRSVRRNRGVRVGDEVSVTVGDVEQTLPVVGIVQDPENLLFPAHPDFEVPIPGSYAVACLSAAAAADVPYADRVDSLLFRFEDGADREALARALREALPVALVGMIPEHKSPARRMVLMVMAIYDIYVPTVTSVLILVALALFVMTIARIVRRQRPQIGTLLAIGHAPGSIAVSMIGVSVVPTVVGGLLGALAHPFVARKIFEAHLDAVGWPPLVDPGPGFEGPATLLACAGIAIVACVVPVLLAARRMPSRLLRHGTWDALSRPPALLGRWAARLRDVLHLPLNVVLGLTTVLRRRWATATAALALAANFAIVLAFLFVHVSHNSEIHKTFNRLALDGIAYFAIPQAEDDLAGMRQPAWTDTEPLITRIAWLDLESGATFLRVTCLRPDGWIQRFPIAEGHALSAPDAPEMLIDYWTADAHDLAVGDRFTCYPGFSAPEGVELEVAGIMDGVSMGLVAVPIETGRRIFELPGMQTGLHVASAQPRQELLDGLRALPDVESAVYLGDARNHVAKTFEAARFILALAMILAIAVGVIFLGILASLDATERSRDLAILRSLGWRDRTIIGLCVTEVTVRGYLALCIALPAAPLVARWILGRIQAANHYRMPLSDPLWLYLAVGGLFAVLVPLGAIPAWRAATSLPSGRIARLLARE